MPLDKQNITVLLGGPLNESIDSKLQDEKSMALARNVVYSKDGLVSKALGWYNFPYSTERANLGIAYPHFMHEHGNELLIGSHAEHVTTKETYFGEHNSLRSQEIGVTGTNIFRNKGHHSPVAQSSKVAVHGEEDYTDCDAVEAAGFRWVVYCYDYSVYYSVTELATGNLVIDNMLLFPGTSVRPRTQPHLVRCTTKIHAFAMEGGNIERNLLDIAVPTTAPGGVAVLIAASAAHQIYDTCMLLNGATATVCVAHVDLAGNNLDVFIYNDDGTAGATYNGGESPREAITCTQVSDYNTALEYILVSYRDAANNLRYLIRDITNGGAHIVAETTILALAARYTVTQITASTEDANAWEDGDLIQTARIWVEMEDATSQSQLGAANAAGVPTVSTLVAPFRVRTAIPGLYALDSFLYHHKLISKAFHHNGLSHVVTSFDSGESQPVAMLCSPSTRSAGVCRYTTESTSLHGTVNSRVGQGLANTSHSSILPVVGAFDEYTWSAIVSSDADTRNVVVCSSRYSESCLKGEMLSGNTLVGGGHLYCYDGTMQENSFAWSPEVDAVSAAILGGGWLWDTTTYSWVFTYEWTDKNGQWHVSAPSDPITETTPTPGAPAHSYHYVFDVKTLDSGSWLRNAQDVKVCMYRTNSPTAGVTGTVYHFVESLDNDQSVQYITFDNDITGPRDIGENRMLYTTGLVLANEPTPPCTQVINHHDRTWLVSTDNPREVWFSKPHVDGIAAEFSSFQVAIIPEDAVALASTTNALLVFTDSKIYSIQGGGPDVLGNGSFYPLQTISLGLGCTNPHSIGETDLGVIFQSDNVLYAISNGLEISPISDPIEDLLDGNLVIGISQDSKNRRIIIVLDDGNVLYMDYGHGRWSFVERGSAIYCSTVRDGSLYGADGTDYVIWKNKQATAVRPYENLILKSVFEMELGTGWLRMDNLTGFTRTRFITILGEWLSMHKMTVDIYTDYNDTTPVQTVEFDCTTSKAPYVLRIKPKYQKSRAIKVVLTVTDLDTTNTGACVDLTGIDFEIGSKGPRPRMGTLSS